MRSAFARFEKDAQYEEFASQDWVYMYGVFRAFKRENQNKCWNEWSQDQKMWPENRALDLNSYKEEIEYQMFLQYLFYLQWLKLKDYARQSNVQIMGDIPFYVGVDSLDVWADKKSFLLDDKGCPKFIAGVPPDYFSSTGQRWGNPIYNWDYLKEKNYDFWSKRFGYNSKLFDILRIDHFRAFDTYWKIPVSCPTAVEGEWLEAPGDEVLTLLLKQYPDLEIVAEDLGDLRKEVIELKERYQLKGMKILEFTLDTTGKYARDIFMGTDNTIVYTGTHDNETLSSWYCNLSAAKKRKIKRFLAREGYRNGSPMERIIAYALNSTAEYTIIPMWDVLGLGKAGRLNTPGTVGSPNWEWKMNDFKTARKKLHTWKRMIKLKA